MAPSGAPAPAGTASLRPASRSAVHARFGVVALAAVVVYLLAGQTVRDVLMVLASAGVTLRVLLMLLRGRLSVTRPWWWVVGGVGLLTVTNLAWLVQVQTAGAASGPAPVSDLTMALGYVCLLVASVLIVMPTARRDTGGVLDAALIAVGLAIVVWTLWLFPALEARGVPETARLYDLVVLLLVAGIAGAVVRAMVSAREARPSLAYVLLAVLCTLAGNAAGVVTAGSTTWTADLPGLLWIIGYLALAGAAAHPSSASLATPGRAWEGRLTSGRLVFLGLALAANPLVAAARELSGGAADWLLLSVGSLVLVPIVLLRVWQLARLHADAERRLAHLADHDPLTGLPNRRALERHLDALQDRVARHQAAGAVVVFVDLDDFKTVNDTLGHGVGDDLLAAVAARLRTCVRADGTDLVARFAGDEFVLVLEGEPVTLAAAAAARVQAALSEPVHVGDHLLPVGGSVGAAQVGPGSTTTTDQLLCEADARMYERKRARRSGGVEDPPSAEPVLPGPAH